MSELLINDTTYTLAAAITSTTATSITVAAVGGSLGSVPTSMSGKTFRIRIDNELMVVTATDSTGLAWTVTRGTEGTTAATHSSATVVYIVTTAAGNAQRVADSCLSGPLSSLPAAGVAGRTYSATNNPIRLVDTGSAWQAFGPVFPLGAIPAQSAFTFYNCNGTAGNTSSSTPAADFTSGLPAFTPYQGTGGAQVCAMCVPVPTGVSSFSLTISVIANAFTNQSFHTGVCFSDGAGKYLTLGFRTGISGNFDGGLYVAYWPTATTVATVTGSPSTTSYFPHELRRFLRLTYNGTTIVPSVSGDGIYFSNATSGSLKSETFTPTMMGFYVSNGSGTPSSSRLISWQVN